MKISMEYNESKLKAQGVCLRPFSLDPLASQARG